MKKVLLSVFGLLLFSTIAVNAQKIGFCEIDKIITIMPEYELAQAKIEGEYNDIQAQMEEMQVEYNNKLKEYQENTALANGAEGKWSPTRLQAKEQDITLLQQRIQEFQMTASGTLEQRQYELLEPISVKLDSAINVVMEEKGYLYIIKDLTSIQVNKNKVDDISPMVKQKLGLE